jgi:hypothetical protein
MKRLLLLPALLLLTALFLNAQEIWHPTMVSKAVYFDKTTPLRGMKVIPPGERDRSWKEDLVESDYQNESFGAVRIEKVALQ